MHSFKLNFPYRPQMNYVLCTLLSYACCRLQMNYVCCRPQMNYALCILQQQINTLNLPMLFLGLYVNVMCAYYRQLTVSQQYFLFLDYCIRENAFIITLKVNTINVPTLHVGSHVLDNSTPCLSSSGMDASRPTGWVFVWICGWIIHTDRCVWKHELMKNQPT
jgi:hypothetical protein